MYNYCQNNNDANAISYSPIVRIIVNEKYIVSLCNGKIHSFSKKNNFEHCGKYEINNNESIFPYMNNYKIYCITADEDVIYIYLVLI